MRVHIDTGAMNTAPYFTSPMAISLLVIFDGNLRFERCFQMRKFVVHSFPHIIRGMDVLQNHRWHLPNALTGLRTNFVFAENVDSIEYKISNVGDWIDSKNLSCSLCWFKRNIGGKKKRPTNSFVMTMTWRSSRELEICCVSCVSLEWSEREKSCFFFLGALQLSTFNISISDVRICEKFDFGRIWNCGVAFMHKSCTESESCYFFVCAFYPPPKISQQQ